MYREIEAPITWVESVVNLRLPAKADERLQELMAENTEGRLSKSERNALEALAELSETLSLVRMEAGRLLISYS
jgi:hypothetical protein